MENESQNIECYQLSIRERRNFRSGFKDFENHYNGVSNLYEKDGKRFLYLSSTETKQKCCIELNPNIELSEQLGLIACNIEAYRGHTITSSEQQEIIVGNERVPLINYDNMEFSNGVTTEKKLSIDDAALKIDSLSIDGYIANSIYKDKINSRVSPEQFEMLEYYKAEGYEFINSFMGKGELRTRGSEKINPEFCRKLLLMDRAFEDNPPLEHDLVVYRGSKSHETEHSSFISTSLSKKEAEFFSSDNVYEIHLPKGTHVLSLDNISGLRREESSAEAEILLRPADFLYRPSQGNEHVVDIKEHDFPKLLLEALERRKEEYLQGKSAADVQAYMESIEFVKKQAGEKVTSRDKMSTMRAKLRAGHSEEAANAPIEPAQQSTAQRSTLNNNQGQDFLKTYVGRINQYTG
ncbi:MAG: hypothetical protein IJZ59_08090 [Alphaproteobacteria bacterium]|nr:hypothetical protein [Alphaproteobacteria bacterium]